MSNQVSSHSAETFKAWCERRGLITSLIHLNNRCKIPTNHRDVTPVIKVGVRTGSNDFKISCECQPEALFLIYYWKLKEKKRSSLNKIITVIITGF